VLLSKVRLTLALNCVRWFLKVFVCVPVEPHIQVASVVLSSFILLAIATRYRSFDRSACAVTSTTDLRRLRQSLHSSCEQVLAGLSIFSLSSLACTCSLLPRIALAVLLFRSTNFLPSCDLRPIITVTYRLTGCVPPEGECESVY
jgi:hypothetical protein